MSYDNKFEMVEEIKVANVREPYIWVRLVEPTKSGAEKKIDLRSMYIDEYGDKKYSKSGLRLNVSESMPLIAALCKAIGLPEENIAAVNKLTGYDTGATEEEVIEDDAIL